MQALRPDSDAPGRDALLVLLPGMGDRAEQFIDSGFVAAYSGSRFDLLPADAHFGYYLDRSLTKRLHEDIVLPARMRGYDEIWLLGISMGGLGSLLYVSEFPDHIDGVILLAPFLGDPCLVEEIDAAGGLTRWSGESSCTQDYEVGVWRWLKQTTQSEAVDIVLGYGEDDRLAPMYVPLLDELPPSRVHMRNGGHNWRTWTNLWASMGERI